MNIKTVTAAELLEGIRSGKSIFAMRMRKHPEQANVFRKYGTPEETASIIRKGSENIFFDNQTLCMTETYLLNRAEPESLLLLCDARAAYPDIKGKNEYLVVHDRWGDVFRYPYAVGQKQVLRITVLIDKIKKAAPDCRTGHRPEDLEYVRQHKEPLPK